MKKVFKNLVSSVLPQIVNIISNLIIPGLIIAKFGSEVNGLVSTTKTVVSYMSLVGAGIATSVTQALYLPVANRDDKSVRGMLNAANKMFNHYGFMYILITCVVAIIYPVVIKSDISNGIVISLLLVMSLSGASEFFAIGRCRALLYADQKVYVCSVIQAASLLISLILAVIMMKLNMGIIPVQFTISMVYVFRGLFLTTYVNKEYPQYMNYKKELQINAAIEKRKDAMIHQLTGLAVTGSQAAILTFLIDLRAASIYSVYNIVISGIKLVCSNICTALTPFLGKRYALQQRSELRNMYNVIECMFFYMVTFVLSVTGVMLIPFISIYTKNADMDYIFPMFAFLFVISAAFYILKLPGIALVNVAGHFKETKGRAILEAVICVIVSVGATMMFGKEGVLIGTGCALGWRCLDTIFYTNRNILNITSKKSFFRLSCSLLNILFFSMLLGRKMINVNSYMSWCLKSAVISSVVLIILAFELLLFERSTINFMCEYIKARKRSGKNEINL